MMVSICAPTGFPCFTGHFVQRYTAGAGSPGEWP